MKRKCLKIIKNSAYTIIVVIAFAFILLQTSPVKNLLLKIAIDKVNQSGEYQIKTSGALGFLPFTLSVEKVELYQNDTLLITADSITIHWSPIRFVIERSLFTNIDCKNLTVLALPTSKNNVLESLEWPTTPFPFLTINMNCKNLVLTSNITKTKELPFDSSFDLSMYGRIGNFAIDGHLRSNVFKGSIASCHIRGNRRNQLVRVELIAEDDYQGLINYCYDLPEIPKFHLRANAIAPFDQWQRFITETSNTGEEILGSLYIEGFNESLAPESILCALFSSENWTANSEFSYSLFDTLSLSKMEINSCNFRAMASFEFNKNFIIQDSHISGNISDLYAIADFIELPVEGPLHFDASLKGNLFNPESSVHCTSDALYLFDYRISDFKWFVNTYQDMAFHGNIDINGYIESNPFSIQTPFSVEKENIHFNPIDLKLQSLTLIGHISVLLNQGYLAGSVDIQAPQLSSFAYLIGHEVDGSMQAKADLDYVIRDGAYKQRLSFNGTFQHFKLNDIKAEKLFSKAHLTTNFSDFRNQLKGKVDMDGENIVKEELKLSILRTKTYIRDKQYFFDLNSEGSYKEYFSLHTIGIWRPLQQGWHLKLDRIRAHALDEYITLNFPMSITYHDKRISFKDIDLSIGSGSLYVTGFPLIDSSEFRATVKDFPLPLINLFYPEFPMVGSINLTAVLDNTDKIPSGTLDMTLENVKLMDISEKASSLNGSVEARLKNESLFVLTRITDQEEQYLKLDLDLPIILSVPTFKAQLKPHEPLFLKMHYEGDINPAWQFLLPQNHLLRGDIQMDLDISGTRDHPDAKGSFSLTDGTYENIYSGLVLRELNLNLKGNQEELVLESLNATDGEKGRICATGNILLTPQRHFPYLLEGYLSKAKLLQLGYVSSIFDGTVAISGNFKKSSISGDLTVIEADVNIPGQIPNPLPKLKVKYINPLPQTDCSKFEEPKGITFPIYFNINLDIPGHAFLRGKGLDSIWKGKISLKGTDMDPFIKGMLQLVSGQFFFSGKTMTLTEGSVTFNGSPTKDTYINLSAEINLSNLRVIAILNGPLESPGLNFRSDPPHDQSEILSLLLFDKNVDELSPFQALALARTVAALSGTYQGPDVIEKLRIGIKLDRLSFGVADNDMQKINIQLGKYITRNVLVTVSQGLTYLSNTEVTAHFVYGFQLQAKIGYAILSELLLLWKYNY